MGTFQYIDRRTDQLTQHNGLLEKRGHQRHSERIEIYEWTIRLDHYYILRLQDSIL